ncbi:hypothetical protein MLD38_028607 [Melastoma candidum]|uniref:Uncharacterized protein n=1 Tax=Melastoma candidum TaxID=119954 RepID=A0ACB9N3R6_9MYRT|nr:hypothetical protein MLD38_028607 [Melastoma candidum]
MYIKSENKEITEQGTEGLASDPPPHKQRMSDCEHFFRLILPDDIRNRNLRIPTKFAKKHGSDLSDSIRLKVPSGFVWEVKLCRKDMDILMQDGWAEFMEHYRICHGSFIVFKYIGGSQFSVVIFDLTACEIEYPIEPVFRVEGVDLANQPLSMPERDNIQDKEVPIILLDDNEGHAEMLGNHIVSKQCPHSTVVKVVNGLRAANYLSSMDVPDLDVELRGVRTIEIIDCHPGARPCQETRTSYIGNLERSAALAKVFSFRRDIPSFVVLPGLSHSEYYLYVPEKFIMPRIPGIGDCKDVNIYLPGLRMWTIGFHSGKGWRQFAMDNNLKAGDACVFELMKRSVVTYHSFLFRDGVSQPRTSPTKEMRATMGSFNREYLSRLDDVYISEVNHQVCDHQVSERNPSFHTVCDKKVKHALPIPCNFVRNHLKRLLGKAVSPAMLRAGGKSWPVALSALGAGSDSCLISSGWWRFVEDNDLRTRDICLFELVDEIDMVFEVAILKIVAP